MRSSRSSPGVGSGRGGSGGSSRGGDVGSSNNSNSPGGGSGSGSGSGNGNVATYPLPAYLEFVPGGIVYPNSNASSADLPSHPPSRGVGRSSSDTSRKDEGFVMLNQVSDPVKWISKAMECDVHLQRLQHGSSSNSSSTAHPAVHHVPSLSFLAEAIFHPLTGVAAAQVRHWVDSILLLYFSLDTATMETGAAGAGGTCSNCTLAAAAVGSTLDATRNAGAGKTGAVSSSPAPEAKKPSSLHSRSYSGGSSSGSVSSSGGLHTPGASSPTHHHTSSPATAAGSSTSAQFQSLLKHLASHHSKTNNSTEQRPCGYVFKRGDIAWNCRTCQTDPTCVLCDTCFHNSNHEGHEVFFHRTSPGGCCDCGDLEAWRLEGCCDAHRPARPAGADEDCSMADVKAKPDLEDEFEAVKSALRGRQANIAAIQSLPPCLRSALSVVIGAAVQCIVRAVDGAGTGADVSQWKLRWAEQIACIANKCVHEEEYVLKKDDDVDALLTPQAILQQAFQADRPPGATGNASFLSPSGSGGLHASSGGGGSTSASPWPSSHAQPQPQPPPSSASPRDMLKSMRSIDSFRNNNNNDNNNSLSQWDGLFPQNYRLHLRLHNDDVHTFDEVIDALYERSPSNNTDPSSDQLTGLVTYREDADKMTHHVDSDGQVTVKSYTNFASALSGFIRLKSRGLLCSVVSTPQVDLELRARSVLKWLMEMSKLHAGVAALVVHALVDVTNGEDELVEGCGVWPEPQWCIWPWDGKKILDSWMTREEVREVYWTNVEQQQQQQQGHHHHHPQRQHQHQHQHPHLASNGESMHMEMDSAHGANFSGNQFYASVPFHLPSESLRKSPHALWGTLGSAKRRVIVDTDIRKQQEADTLTESLHPHRLAGLSILSGVALLEDGFVHPTLGTIMDSVTSPYLAMHNLAVSQREIEYLVNNKTSFQAPCSPLLVMLLLDPYPTKQFRYALHNLFLSLLTEARFKARFAATLGVVAYRPLTTLFCAGVGTESDTPLGFTVQIFTAGSLVRALGDCHVCTSLLDCDAEEKEEDMSSGSRIPTRTLPVALTILRAIHTNLLGATKEVKMLLQNTAAAAGGSSGAPSVSSPVSSSSAGSHSFQNLGVSLGSASAFSSTSTVSQHMSHGEQAAFSPTHAGQGYLPALVYQNGEHAQSTLLPAAPDDGFLDSRSTRHKRLPHLLRDLEYIFETPGTALKLLSQMDNVSAPGHDNPRKSPTKGVEGQKNDKVLDFATAFARLLRLAQNMDPQKRKISGGHVEYEQQRWLDAFGLSLNLAGMRDALVESPTLLANTIAPAAAAAAAPPSPNGSSKLMPTLGQNRSNFYLARKALGHLFTALLREIKLCLYREGLLENGLLPASFTSAHSHTGLALGQMTEPPQRSTLHVGPLGTAGAGGGSGSSNSVALACATGVKMTENQLGIIETALRHEYGQNRGSVLDGTGTGGSPMRSSGGGSGGGGVIMGDWLKVPHTPLSGDWLSFHLPLHRALARSMKSLCSIPVPQGERDMYPDSWWKVPVLDGTDYYLPTNEDSSEGVFQQHNHLSQMLLPTLRSSNCRVVWHNPDASPDQSSVRRMRSYTVSSTIAAAKVIHSLADHPLRCLAAATQIEKHLWARNGSAAAGMAHNYASAPLCKSFRDLDLCLLQFSAAGFEVGLGARRTLALTLSRFSMDGFLVDPVLRRTSSASSSVPGGVHGHQWVQPPRLQDPDHASSLAESFFAIICLLVTELPPPPPLGTNDETAVRRSMRRELIHALAAEPRSYSEALAAAVSGATRRDHHLHNQSSGGGGEVGSGNTSLRSIFNELLREVARERQAARSGGTRSGSGAPTFELTASCADEYDPTFYHLRRNEHQHAMDTVARLRKQKCSGAANGSGSPSRTVGVGVKMHSKGDAAKGEMCLPLVCPPPEAHPRFMPCRLILHLPTTDAAIRRKLLFALTGGEWLPPPELPKPQPTSIEGASSTDGFESLSSTDQPVLLSASSSGSFGSLRTSSRRSASSSEQYNSASTVPFSPAVVASSAVSSLEVLQILTLQVHTLEHCAALHRMQSLDNDSARISSSITVDSYLSRLCKVPASLENCWALGCPHPLPSSGSGENRGSILGLLVALYEHSYHANAGGADSSSSPDADGGKAGGGSGDDSHSGGARSLASDGIKWLLRFVHALVHGASSVSVAIQSATAGIPVPLQRFSNGANYGSPVRRVSDSVAWTISDDVKTKISGMLESLPKLWPSDENSDRARSRGSPMLNMGSSVGEQGDAASSSGTPDRRASGATVGSSGGESTSDMTKAKLDLRKAAQERALKMMSMQRSRFIDSLAVDDEDETEDMDVDADNKSDVGKKDDDDDDCIICHCAADESDSPLGFLGHVQRSRTLQLRMVAENDADTLQDEDSYHSLSMAARVVGDRGCQLRATPSMDSAPVACLPLGSIVTILKARVSPKYGLLSRRVLVRHASRADDDTRSGTEASRTLEGWASIQSSQGYVILSPLSKLCFSRWGLTRPIVRLCGHAAHLGCVEGHCLSLHQRAAGDHPFDGRYAANIEEGEFLCPLCKQISNVFVPRQQNSRASVGSSSPAASTLTVTDMFASLKSLLITRHLDNKEGNKGNEKGVTAKKLEAERRFGSQLLQAMQISWDASISMRRRNSSWNSVLNKWDYEEDGPDAAEEGTERPGNKKGVGKVLQLLREQHIAWSAVGYGAATAEASTRISSFDGGKSGASLSSTPAALISDPWNGYSHETRDSHSSLVELRRIVGATSGFLEVLGAELNRLDHKVGKTEEGEGGTGAGVAFVGFLLLDIMVGRSGGLASLMGSAQGSPNGSKQTNPAEVGWHSLAALLASMPCHVARDGVLAQRHEARATAAEMWAVKGRVSSSEVNSASMTDDTSTNLSAPPTPLCVRLLNESDNRPSAGLSATSDWGSANVSKIMASFQGADGSKTAPIPFRPAVASAFLYMPLLSWDLNAFAGAVFSTLLCERSASRAASVDDLSNAARVLLVARIVQALVTPNGLNTDSVSTDRNTENPEVLGTIPKLGPAGLAREAQALNTLRKHCVEQICFAAEVSDLPESSGTDANSEKEIQMLNSLGDAILPFARTLVLLLRVGFSTVRLRQKRQKKATIAGHATDSLVVSAVENPHVMECADGFSILRVLGGPLPTELMKEPSNSSYENEMHWLNTINQWIVSVVALESHHGSRGSTTRFDAVSKKWIPSYVAGSELPSSSPQEKRVHSLLEGDDTKLAAKKSVASGMAPVARGISSLSSSEKTGLNSSGSGFGQSENENSPRRIVNPYWYGAEGENDGREADSSDSFDEDEGGDYVEDEEMDDEANEANDAMHEDSSGVAVDNFRMNPMVDEDELDSEDEEMEPVEELNFDDAAMGVDPAAFSLGLPGRGTASSSAEWKDDDEESSECSVLSSGNNTEDAGGRERAVDRGFANVSRGAIIPFQPSLLGKERLGPGPRGNCVDMVSASRLMYDMSHMGLVHNSGKQGSGLIKLPRSFVELYGLVNRVKGDAVDEQDDGGSSETAICLITGAVMRSGSVRRAFSRAHTRPPGACTVHARKVGSGIGIFFLVQKCTVLLMHNNKSAYSASLYVDENGEEDPGLRRGRPLFLQGTRYEALASLWRQHGIPREVAQIRSTSDRVIRDNWY